MPQLLDTRLIGYDIADVTTRSYEGATVGQALVVAPDGDSMRLATVQGAENSQNSKDSDLTRTGWSLQQFLVTTWQDVSPTSPGYTPFTSVNGLAYGKNVVVAVGATAANGQTLAYTNGDVLPGWAGAGGWIKTDPFVDPFSSTGSVGLDVDYGDGLFVAVGSNGLIASSINGRQWTVRRNAGSGEHLRRVRYGAGKGWLVVGTQTSSDTSAGVTIYSPDGITWTNVTPALGSGVPIYGLTFGQGTWMAVGGVTGGSTNRVATSINGKEWTIRTSNQPSNAHLTAHFGDGRWTVGTDGAISTIRTINFEEWFDSDPDEPTVGACGTIHFGNGLWIAGTNQIYASNDGISFHDVALPGFAPIAKSSTYANGVFLIGGSDGRIFRSAMINEVTGGGGGGGGGAPVTGPTGPAGLPGGGTGTLITGPTGPAGPAGGSGGGAAVYTGNNQCNTDYPVGSYVTGLLLSGGTTGFPATLPNNAPVMNSVVYAYACTYSTGTVQVFTFDNGPSSRLLGTWVMRGVAGIRLIPPDEGTSYTADSWLLIQRIS